MNTNTLTATMKNLLQVELESGKVVSVYQEPKYLDPRIIASIKVNCPVTVRVTVSGSYAREIVPVAQPTGVRMMRVKGGQTSGFGPTTYHHYYNVVPGAKQAGYEVVEMPNLLLYKQGGIVVTGRSIRWDHKDYLIKIEESVGRPREVAKGILPDDAKDGFYTWTGQAWEQAEIVVVQVTRVWWEKSIDRPACYRFLGVRGKDGRLVTNQNKGDTAFPGHEFFELCPFPKTAPTNGFAVVETAVEKPGFWSLQEEAIWTELELEFGLDPDLLEYVQMLDCVTVIKQRLDKYCRRIKISLLDGEKILYQMVHEAEIRGDGTLAGAGAPMGLLMQGEDAAYFLSSIPAELKSFMELVAALPYSHGEFEEELLAKTQGQHYWANDGSVADFASFCPHGWRTGLAMNCSYGHLQPNDPKKLLRIVTKDACYVTPWQCKCPHGCTTQEPTLFLVPEWEADTFAVEPGMHSLEKLRTAYLNK